MVSQLGRRDTVRQFGFETADICETRETLGSVSRRAHQYIQLHNSINCINCLNCLTCIVMYKEYLSCRSADPNCPTTVSRSNARDSERVPLFAEGVAQYYCCDRASAEQLHADAWRDIRRRLGFAVDWLRLARQSHGKPKRRG
jgi:hypothetical protein